MVRNGKLLIALQMLCAGTLTASNNQDDFTVGYDKNAYFAVQNAVTEHKDAWDSVHPRDRPTGINPNRPTMGDIAADTGLSEASVRMVLIAHQMNAHAMSNRSLPEGQRSDNSSAAIRNAGLGGVLDSYNKMGNVAKHEDVGGGAKSKKK